MTYISDFFDYLLTEYTELIIRQQGFDVLSDIFGLFLFIGRTWANTTYWGKSVCNASLSMGFYARHKMHIKCDKNSDTIKFP